MRLAQSTVATGGAYTAGSALTGSIALIPFTGNFAYCYVGFISLM